VVRGLRDSGLDFVSAAGDVHFTRPLVGPMFMEVVARAGTSAPVETAPGVFNAIERDQISRGYV
jgi:4-hydroxyphenylpyruvate dioxygenase-like putative hemolysin